jgi:hypothetical protein
MDAPEQDTCGYQSATDYLAFVLRFAPDGVVHLEYDQTREDGYGRRLAYVWYELGRDVYQVNEVMIRNGWAESEAYAPDVKWSLQLNKAEQFSLDHVLGVRLECGGFHEAIGSEPSEEQKRQAEKNQPNQGQFAWVADGENATMTNPGESYTAGNDGADGSGDGSGDDSDYTAPVPTEEPPAAETSGSCDPSYPGVCIAPISQVGDLDCGQVPYARFQVIPPDPHGFDADSDGVGCESN